MKDTQLKYASGCPMHAENHTDYIDPNNMVGIKNLFSLLQHRPFHPDFCLLSAVTTQTKLIMLKINEKARNPLND